MKVEDQALLLAAEGCSRAEIVAATGITRNRAKKLKQQSAADAADQLQKQIASAFRAWPAAVSPERVISL
ncbi:hypothetical protein ABFO19_09230 [Xanthomonas citri pv. glycines]|uniref:Helix-turn-helix domain-containing protein n=1 Tax=Xanthomonas campestris pv. glycines TaxID=473421 RepID=A0AAX0I4N2_XANCG|nr:MULTISPECIES: hypothetical protein [Xanthomonas]AOY63414.1 hypothetical protein BHE84_15465 [Xanthomonas citri pv. glycines str. 8ra]OEY98636.1 hypothetical protein BIY41_09720 [Xanthomonas citri pv. glycines]OOW99964.1 hypothetical protein Xgly_03010 [Xanthomonas citri pv. glycines]QDR44935.1 hypothetical protein FPK90_09680 [Xanthomonas citri pv. glycines]QDS11405.1 hypothetical protein FPL03_09670 [Xanthomonas citri pv. glycines]